MLRLALHLELLHECALLIPHGGRSGTPDQHIRVHNPHALGKKVRMPVTSHTVGQRAATRTAGKHCTSEVPAHLGAVTQEL